MNKNTFILLTAALVGSQAIAGSVTVPNTFVDGTTASASEVNGNFDALSGAINDNDARVTTNANDINILKQQITDLQVKLEIIKTVYVKANNTILGVHIGHSGAGSPVIEFINDQGYLVNISSGANSVAEGTLLPVGNSGNLTYESTNCQGQAYIFHNIAIGDVPANMGVVSRSPYPSDTTLIYYVPKGTLPVNNVSLLSELTSSGCQGYSTPYSRVWPAYPNNPVVTGVNETLYTAPITLERASFP